MGRRTNCWGEDRVFTYDRTGTLTSFPTTITDVVPVDAFTRISAGRSAFRVDDLLALRARLDRPASRRRGAGDV